MSKLLKVAILCCAVALAGNLSAGARDVLPEGAGVEVVRNKCTICHEADLIVAQRLSLQGWTREVEKMIRWGTEVTESEKSTIIAYLAAHFGQRPLEAKSSAPPAAAQTAAAGGERGKAIFEAKCLICHESDLSEQQRLSRAGWTREVEKMIRWGADVSEAEKEPLIDYLASRYGPRKK